MTQEETADAFDAVEASFHVEHDEEGRHSKPFTAGLSVTTGVAQLLGGTLLGALLALEDGYANTITTNVNDLAQPNGAPIDDVMIRLQATSALNVTGLVPSDPTSTRRQIHLIENGGSFTIRLKQASASSVYPFSLPGELDLDLESGGVVLIQWDPHSQIWRCLQSGTPMATVQRGTITFTNGGPDIVDATISTVDFDSAELRSSFRGEAVGFTVGVQLLDDHRVRAERYGAFNSSPAVVYFEVSGRLI